eukprot:8043136-Pyramimonas_sp.AAC.1
MRRSRKLLRHREKMCWEQVANGRFIAFKEAVERNDGYIVHKMARLIAQTTRGGRNTAYIIRVEGAVEE